ncbi:zeta toxin family protein [Glutamicibacter soli]|uniref:zeta toxin family protein n=1 Tax=Glutamicibacter soli TaxID=453836 RepID=UPI003C7571B1
MLDADEFKELLLREAQANGNYEAEIKPNEIKRREVAGEEFFPVELATLVPEESSQLSTALCSDCIAKGLNIVVDKVLHSADGARQPIGELDAAGYRVETIEVRVPFDVSQQRITQRSKEAFAASLEPRDDLGARCAPYQFARKVFDAPGGQVQAGDCCRATGFRVSRRGCATARAARQTAIPRMRTISVCWRWTCPNPATARSWWKPHSRRSEPSAVTPR